jgi:hypothetical protein
MFQPPRLRNRKEAGSSAGTDTSYIVETRVFQDDHRDSVDESYDADYSDRGGSSISRTNNRDNIISSSKYTNKNIIQDHGVELVLNQTTDSQRARDMIVPGSRRRRGSSCSVPVSPYHKASSSKHHTIQVETVDSQSVASTTDLRTSKQLEQQQGPRPHDTVDGACVNSTFSQRSKFMIDHASDVASVASRSVDSSSRALFDDTSEASSAGSGGGGGSSKPLLYPLKDGDTIWRAAKRGDLTALKRFHSHGNVDWAAVDQFGNTPLFYACHSGAIVDINVVHFLLWVTPIHELELEKCKNRKNKAVMKILNDFEVSGYTTSPIQTPTGGPKGSNFVESDKVEQKERRQDTVSMFRAFTFFIQDSFTHPSWTLFVRFAGIKASSSSFFKEADDNRRCRDFLRQHKEYQHKEYEQK